MKSILKILFGNGEHDKEKKPLVVDNRVRDLKNKYAEGMLEVQVETKNVEKAVEKLKEKVNRTYIIAQALGKI